MRDIDKLMVRRQELPNITSASDWRNHQAAALARLREVTFRHTVAEAVPRQREFRDDGQDSGGTSATYAFESFDGLSLGIKTRRPTLAQTAVPTLVFAVQPDARSSFAGGGSSRPRVSGSVMTAAVEVRNTGANSVGPGYLWTARRTYPLLGQTLPERQISDLLAALALLRQQTVTGSLAVYGQGTTAPLAIYAALLDPRVTEIVLAEPPTSHEDPQTAELLGVLRVGDLPHNLALAYPRPITFVGNLPEAYTWTRQLYEQLGAGDQIRVIGSVSEWQPHR